MKILLLSVLGMLSVAGSAAERNQVFVQGVTVTAKALATQLEDYVAAERELKGGSILVHDEELKSVVALVPVKLDDGSHIHWLGADRFLSWGEFKDADGNQYFLDFYLVLRDGKLVFSGPLTIYSRNKVKRYAWDESGEVMTRKPAPKAVK